MSVWVPKRLAAYYQYEQYKADLEQADDAARAQRAPASSAPAQPATPFVRAMENPQQGSRDYLDRMQWESDAWTYPRWRQVCHSMSCSRTLVMRPATRANLPEYAAMPGSAPPSPVQWL